ncbi:hypothetical protein BKA64DRAFT_708939 [Cadophora sp. MPI-SDFR-AT-0126]|nr:hypothetical protein BKA64DRAFT_708939 [Leotiomycetes sp. MPI-SDFR-AT-0126]
MLSNPTKNLHNRQRQHRRQQSTPNAFEPVKATNLPNIQRHNSHRRGMSLDQRRRQTPPQEYMVSNTNPGYQTTQPQHILRETQQQRLARPGQNQFTQFDNDENYLNSPAVTPQRQSFDAGCTNQYGNRLSQSEFQFPGPINTIISVDPNSYNGNQDLNLYQAETVLTPSAYLDFSAGFENSSQGTNSQTHSRRSSAGRRISGGIMDRVAQFEHLALQSPCRPITPPNQNVSHYFPPTPVDTPHDRMIKQEQMNQRFLDTYDTSMEETIKPRSNQRARGIFDDMRKEAEMGYMPTPPQTGRIATRSNFDSAPMPTSNYMDVSSMNLQFMKNEPLDSPQYSPQSNNVSFQSSQNSSPEVVQSAMFDPFVNKPELETPEMSYQEVPNRGLPMSSSPSHQSHQSSHRRSESVCSINLDESITDTGITIDDIATFIQGPDPSDGKWICLYPECNKRFGRKENIKSHVQTHLGDRQFQCPHCQKCFVRQHDLKRHAKIHSGVKPYPCQCGNSFARHDALTRHRQRGMCIGAFEGVVKKTVKRGRPRKNRPDNEERIKKSSRTRSKNKAMSSSSSTSGSDSRDGQSPRSELDVLDDKPFGDFDYSQQSQNQNQYNQHSSLMDNSNFEYSQPRSPTPANCVSPQAIQSVHSPSAYSTHSHQSHRGSVSESVHHQSHPASPAKSIHSYHSPPGLCESSSSPAASIYYDMDSASQHNGDGVHMSLNLNGLGNISEHDDEMFLEAFSAAAANHLNGDMTALEREPDLLMGKFEDAFAAHDADDLFRNSEDVFFGSP